MDITINNIPYLERELSNLNPNKLSDIDKIKEIEKSIRKLSKLKRLNNVCGSLRLNYAYKVQLGRIYNEDYYIIEFDTNHKTYSKLDNEVSICKEVSGSIFFGYHTNCEKLRLSIPQSLYDDNVNIMNIIDEFTQSKKIEQI
jgi:hypothetical protein